MNDAGSAMFAPVVYACALWELRERGNRKVRSYLYEVNRSLSRVRFRAALDSWAMDHHLLFRLFRDAEPSTWTAKVKTGRLAGPPCMPVFFCSLILLFQLPFVGTALGRSGFDGVWQIVIIPSDTGSSAIPTKQSVLKIWDKKVDLGELAVLAGAIYDLKTFKDDLKRFKAELQDRFRQKVQESAIRVIFISGWGGCNYFTDRYLVDEQGNLEFLSEVMTAMVCAAQPVDKALSDNTAASDHSALKQQTRRMPENEPLAADALNGLTKLAMAGDSLLMLDKNGKVLARFERVK